jgi:holin-like protein
MLGALTLLLLFQLAGEVVVQLFVLPVPGPVIGMALLFAALVIRDGAPDNLRTTANSLLQHLSLLFVPAGVGVMVHFSRLGNEWPAILAALLVSTFATLGVTGLLLCALLRKSGKSQP